eukprot:scaffold117088_cov18-Phaeocystis_antarctica.AAC.1
MQASMLLITKHEQERRSGEGRHFEHIGFPFSAHFYPELRFTSPKKHRAAQKRRRNDRCATRIDALAHPRSPRSGSPLASRSL